MGKDKILVVDDEPGIQESCRKVLCSEGYQVETASDGIAGLEVFEQHGDFVAALIDLKMPRMGGLQLIERLHERDEHLALFVITAYATIETAVDATRKGAYAYITKPFTPEELLLPVKNGLEKRSLILETRHLRQEREECLLEVAYERSKCATIIECMTDGVLVVNNNGQVVLENDAAVRMLDLPSLPYSIDALQEPALAEMLSEMLNTGRLPNITSREIRLRDTACLVHMSPVVDEDKKVLGGLAVLADITAFRELAAAKTSFVSMVAHELKSPLAATEGYLQLVLEKKGEGFSQKNCERIERSLLRITTLRKQVDELMSLRAMESGQFSLTRICLRITDVLDESIAFCADAAAHKNITITKNYIGAPSYHDVLADRDAAARIFVNLIENAVKYTPSGGHVTVETRTDGRHMRIAVQDDGIGIDAKYQKDIFEEFFRVRNAFTAGVPGTGLGLSLVKTLVEMHNGKISVISTPGTGTEFTVQLPMTDKCKE